MDENLIQCRSCPIRCKIRPSASGACRRYTNIGGKLCRNRELLESNPNASYCDDNIRKPIITGVGAGTTYPCMKPAPFIVSDMRDDVEVITVVTEAPLSYSGVIVKIDTNQYIGNAGDSIFIENKQVGMLLPEEYGSKMLSIGGAEIFTSDAGLTAVKVVTSLANGESQHLGIGNHNLMVQAGFPPIIDGKAESRMRFGCGSATIGIFAERMKKAADEVIVLDHNITGLLTEHPAGEEVGLSWSGVIVNGKKSSPGRYFAERGEGVAGTSYKCALDVVSGVDKRFAFDGMTLFITDTIGETREYYYLDSLGKFRPQKLPESAIQLADDIAANCEISSTSVIYTGGSGGSARGGVSKCPIMLTKAVHEKKATLTIGGVEAYVLPGGGINFMVDTTEMAAGCFSWIPTPATVAPVEYTMTMEDYKNIKGHIEKIIPVGQLRKKEV